MDMFPFILKLLKVLKIKSGADVVAIRYGTHAVIDCLHIEFEKIINDKMFRKRIPISATEMDSYKLESFFVEWMCNTFKRECKEKEIEAQNGTADKTTNQSIKANQRIDNCGSSDRVSHVLSNAIETSVSATLHHSGGHRESGGQTSSEGDQRTG
jgi:hypothetical protein